MLGMWEKTRALKRNPQGHGDKLHTASTRGQNWTRCLKHWHYWRRHCGTGVPAQRRVFPLRCMPRVVAGRRAFIILWVSQLCIYPEQYITDCSVACAPLVQRIKSLKLTSVHWSTRLPFTGAFIRHFKTDICNCQHFWFNPFIVCFHWQTPVDTNFITLPPLPLRPTHLLLNTRKLWICSRTVLCLASQ